MSSDLQHSFADTNCACALATDNTSAAPAIVSVPAKRPPRPRIECRKWLQRLGLIYQHDWNVVPHFVAKPTLVANQFVLFRAILEVTFAFRADQNLEQPLIQHSRSFPLSDGRVLVPDRISQKFQC